MSRFLENLRHPTMLLPSIILAWTTYCVVTRYSIAPFLDQWMFLAEYQVLQRDGFSIKWLFSEHNEHRIATSRPFFLFDIEYFGARNTFLVYCILFMHLIGIILFIKLIVHDERHNSYQIALALALLTSLSQWQNFLQGFQLQFIGVYAIGVWSIYLFFAPNADAAPRWPRTLASVLLLLLCAATMANGFLVGMAIFAIALLTGRTTWSAALVAATTCAVAAVYAGGDRSSAHYLELVRSHGFDLARYVFAYLGGVWSFAIGGVSGAIVIGAAGMAAMLCALLRLSRERDPRKSVLAAIMVFVALTAVLTALGRVQFGPTQALNSRYATPSAYFWAAIVLFWSFEWRARPPRLAINAAALTGLALLLVVQLFADADSNGWSLRNRRGAALLRAGDNEAAVRILSQNDPQVMALGAANARSIALLRARRLSVFSDRPNADRLAAF